MSSQIYCYNLGVFKVPCLGFVRLPKGYIEFLKGVEAVGAYAENQRISGEEGGGWQGEQLAIWAEW